MNFPFKSIWLARWTWRSLGLITLLAMVVVAVLYGTGRLAIPAPIAGMPQSLFHLDPAYVPAIVALVGGLSLRWWPVNHWTSAAVKILTCGLALRYLIWRTTTTLNFGSLPATSFSVALYVIEVMGLLSLILSMLQTLRSTTLRRSQQADRYEALIQVAEYQPTVDVLILIDRQPEYAVRRTIMACQAMRYPYKTLYVLDATPRELMADLAAELNCGYLTRSPDDAPQAVSQADRLNTALTQTQGELVAVIEADFVPFRNWLDRVVGFFYRSDLAMVQTPQTFHHPGSDVRSVDLERWHPNDVALLDGAGQSHRDVFDTLLCGGSCYVMRRQSLVAAGGYATAGAAATSLKLLAQGGKLVYLNERLTLAAATRTVGDWLDRQWQLYQSHTQVWQWVGNRPLWRRLSWVQKTFLVSQLVHCFPVLARLGWLVLPILSLQWGIFPVVPLAAVMNYFVPFWVVLVAMLGWTTGDGRSYWRSEVASVAFCLSALNRSLFGWLPGRRRVAPPRTDGVTTSRNYNWPQTLPLAAIGLWMVGVVLGHLWNPARGLFMLPNVQLIPLYVWLAYNFGLITLAIGALIDQPMRRMCDRLPLQLPCRFLVAGDKWPCCTVDLSEQGARLHMLLDGFPVAALPEVITLELGHPALKLAARVVAATQVKRRSYIQVAFQKLTVVQQRQLIELIYASPQNWQERPAMGRLAAWRAMVFDRPQGIAGSWGQVRPISRHSR